MTMNPRMSEKECDLFVSFLRNADSYLEFGAGGSTWIASNHVGKSIISVDSSREWLEKVLGACAESKVKPILLHVDIGKVGDWGFPLDRDSAEKWPSYHEAVWSFRESPDADLIMVDGRFRIACFAQAVLRCRPKSIIGFHDFRSRPHYHCVNDLAREIACAEDISFFQPLDDARERAKNLVARHRFDPN
jgi:hypothetical protein